MKRRTPQARLITALIVVLVAIHIFDCKSAAQDPTGRPPVPNRRRRQPPKPPNNVPANTITLTVMTQPAECLVLVNGEDRGTTDSEGKVIINKLPAGHYIIEVRKSGFTAVTRGFEAGTEQPTLVFKLLASVDADVKKFDSLLASGKLTRPDDPNALEVVKDLSNKFPDRPEIAKMRATLFQKLMEVAEAAVKTTTSSWRTASDETVVRGRTAASGAVELKDDDNRARACDVYLEAAHLLRTWQISLRTGSADNGRKGADPARAQHSEDADAAKLSEIRLKFENAAQIQPSWAPPLYQSGTVLLLLKDYLAAQAAFSKAIQLEPSWPAPHIGLAGAFYQLGKHKEAIEEYQKAIQLDPRSSAAYAGRGLALSARGQARESARDLDKAIELDPATALPHLYRGIILSQSKKKKEQETALEELKRAIEMNPDNIEFPNSVAELHVTNLKSKLGTK